MPRDSCKCSRSLVQYISLLLLRWLTQLIGRPQGSPRPWDYKVLDVVMNERLEILVFDTEFWIARQTPVVKAKGKSNSRDEDIHEAKIGRKSCWDRAGHR
jgi:hypothetical protein